MTARTDLLRALIECPQPERHRALRKLTDAERADLRYFWKLWARAEQVAPPGDWSTWLISAGRGFGKTRAGAEWVREYARRHPDGRIALIGASLGEARSVMVEGESGLLAISPPTNLPLFEPTLRRVSWANGAQAFLYSAAEPDSLRGPQHHIAPRPGAEGVLRQRGPCPDRLAAPSVGRRRGSQSASVPGRGRVLAGDRSGHRGMDWLGRIAGGLLVGNLDRHPAERRDAPVRPRNGPVRALSCRLATLRNTGLACRWPGAGQRIAGCFRFAACVTEAGRNPRSNVAGTFSG